MRTDRWLIGALALLVTGIWTLLAWCNGAVGFSFAYPVSGTKFTMDVTSMGAPALIGIPLIFLGVVLMAIAFIAAVIAQFRGTGEAREETSITRLKIPFEE